jgi:Tetratricopeptide repeat
MARSPQAREQDQAALAITHRTRGDRHTDTARSLQNLATVDQLVGDYGRAETQLSDAVAILPRQGVTPK